MKPPERGTARIVSSYIQSTPSGDATHSKNITERGEILEGLHNLKSRICDFENLMGAYRDASKDKRYRDEVLSFGFNLEKTYGAYSGIYGI